VVLPKSENATKRVDYDAELHLHNAVLRRALDIDRSARVLDVGCGTGATTRDAARMAVAGSALGVDVSAPMIRRAGELTDAEGLRNVTYVVADAQAHGFPEEYFDVAISRFGTMFFADPVAGFSNIARALRRGGRLVMMVWQDRDRNEWSVSIDRVLFGDDPAPPPKNLDPFSLGDPTMVRAILDASGFVDALFTDVHEPVFYGRNVTAALHWVRSFSIVNDALQRIDPSSSQRVLERLNDALAAHARGDGVWFDSRAWIVSACRR
jgi:SAM-dependent methyltransferase